MTVQRIETLQAVEARKVEAKYGTARQVRAILDAAREQYGAEDWDDNAIQDEVLELVTEEVTP